MLRNLAEANYVQAMIDKLGVKDVILVYDHGINLWGVAQVFKKPQTIITMDQAAQTGANLMFWIKNNDGTYRVPSDQDVNDVIAIVTRAQVWFDKGSDKMIDIIEEEELKKHGENRRKQSERIRSFAKPMKKAIRKELL